MSLAIDLQPPGPRTGGVNLPEPVEETSTSPGPGRSTATGPLYAVVWRWHFYAGLLVSPILWVITITGALYVFRTELTAWWDRSMLVVEPREHRLSYDELRAIAARAGGVDEVDGIHVRPEPDQSVRFIMDVKDKSGRAGEHRHRVIYLDPYTGEVLGNRIREEEFFEVVLELHRSLFLGPTGRVLGELATSWVLVLLGTGLYLWWPRGKKNVGVWKPRVRGKTYAILRDWHAVVGAYAAPLAALAAGTGLFFSIVWGTGYNTAAKQAGHWPAKWFGVPKSPTPPPGAQPASLDQAVATFLAHSRPGDNVLIRPSRAPGVAHRAFMLQDEDKNTFRMVTVDPYTAKPIDVINVAELPLLYRVRVWAVSIHMGQIFGTPTKILALVASLVLFALSVTGVWMWWRRRPRGRTGVPRRPMPGSLPRWGWGLVVLTGLLLPAAGASMVLITLLDRLIMPLRRRIA